MSSRCCVSPPCLPRALPSFAAAIRFVQEIAAERCRTASLPSRARRRRDKRRGVRGRLSGFFPRSTGRRRRLVAWQTAVRRPNTPAETGNFSSRPRPNATTTKTRLSGPTQPARRRPSHRPSCNSERSTAGPTTVSMAMPRTGKEAGACAGGARWSQMDRLADPAAKGRATTTDRTRQWTLCEASPGAGREREQQDSLTRKPRHKPPPPDPHPGREALPRAYWEQYPGSPFSACAHSRPFVRTGRAEHRVCRIRKCWISELEQVCKAAAGLSAQPNHRADRTAQGSGLCMAAVHSTHPAAWLVDASKLTQIGRDLADAFPETEVVGTDISPIQPSWVPPNVRL